jgi:undecaprenyl-diphosphatase
MVRSLALVGLLVLLALALELGWWSRFDDSVSDWVASQQGTLLWHAAKVVFDVATPVIELPITLALGLVLAWRRHRWEIAGEAAIRVGLVVALVLLLKPLLAVPGPRSTGDHGGSFPSGHTTSTLVCVALILAWVGWPRSITGRVAVSGVVVVIVGLSVIYLNYHYVSDVVGGIMLGLLIATLPLPVFRRRRERE